MIVKIKGSHEFFRSVCQCARHLGKESIGKVISNDTANEATQEVMDTILDELGFLISYKENIPSATDFDIFPDCDAEADIVEMYAADLDDDGFSEEEIADMTHELKIFIVVETLIFEVLSKLFSSKIVQEAA